jgi:bifunctional DNA-binding transcriptional regulator/antitoxin component of YhaV-PrlF toxin-antitoxin module
MYNILNYCLDTSIEDDNLPHKEFRKIIRVGDTSYAVIIPISWLRYYNLKYGDKVEVISNGSIEIRPNNKDISTQKKEFISEIKDHINLEV